MKAKTIAQLRVQDVMSKELVAVNPGDTLHEALELIVENRISALPVINGRGGCVGMLSTSDLIDLTHELDDELQNVGRRREGRSSWVIDKLSGMLGSERVADHMTEQVAAIQPQSPLAEAAAEMVRNHVHRLPVIDRSERLVGIISTMDILIAVADGAGG